MVASCTAAFALSGVITNARDGDSVATSNNGPALVFQFRSGAVGVESTGGTTLVTVESVRTGTFPRSHPAPINAVAQHRERRNRFI
jgi:hypothetical protein